MTWALAGKLTNHVACFRLEGRSREMQTQIIFQRLNCQLFPVKKDEILHFAGKKEQDPQQARNFMVLEGIKHKK